MNFLFENSEKKIKKTGGFWYLSFVFLVAFILGYGSLAFFNLLPESLDLVGPSQFVKLELPQRTKENFVNFDTLSIPEKIQIPKIGVNAVVYNPGSISVNSLDDSLKKGAVYYPSSGAIEKGNIFIFGHSATNFPLVQNPAFKVFNNLEKLERGDKIILSSGNDDFIYLVGDVQLKDADEAIVRFDDSRRKLTISTCNTFGQKQERWVVEANFSEQGL